MSVMARTRFVMRRFEREAPAVPARRQLAGAVAALLMLTLAACGGSSAGPSHTSAAPSNTGADTVSAATATPTAGASAASAADIAAIRTAYTDFADPAVPVSDKLKLLQDGPAFASVLEQAGGAYAQSSSVKVSTATIDSANKATVTFDILLGGSPVLSNQTGYAIRQDGAWKIAGVTVCQLLSLQGTTPSVCSQPAATSLPS